MMDSDNIDHVDIMFEVDLIKDVLTSPTHIKHLYMGA